MRNVIKSCAALLGALALVLSLLGADGARADALGPLDGGLVDAAQLRAGDFAVRPVSPVLLPDAGAAPAPASWWHSLLTAGATLGGVGILLAIRHYVPDADPCLALSAVR